MNRFLKGVMKNCNHGIDRWDEPSVRTRPDGTKVVGRPTRGFGSGGAFTYAGKEYKPEPWTGFMFLVKCEAEDIVEDAIGYRPDFTFCLAGLYPSGNDGIPHHSDTVPTEDDLVFSLSVGAPRTFEWSRYKYYLKGHTNTSDITMHADNSCYTTTYLMEDGDAFLFDGRSLYTSTHAVPELMGVGERINLTFRTGL